MRLSVYLTLFSVKAKKYWKSDWFSQSFFYVVWFFCFCFVLFFILNICGSSNFSIFLRFGNPDPGSYRLSVPIFLFPRFVNPDPGSYQLSVPIFLFPRFGNLDPGSCQFSVSVSKVLVIQKPSIPSDRAFLFEIRPHLQCPVRVSIPGPLYLKSDALPIGLPGALV